MGPNSIVVIIPHSLRDDVQFDWLPVMDEKTPYIIREVVICHISGMRVAYLEEGVIGYIPRGREIGISLKWLREILPPETVDIEEIVKEVNYEIA